MLPGRPQDERTAKVRVVLVIGIVSLSIVLAWTAPKLAKFAWLFFLVVPPTASDCPGRSNGSRWEPKKDGDTPSEVGTR